MPRFSWSRVLHPFRSGNKKKHQPLSDVITTATTNEPFIINNNDNNNNSTIPSLSYSSCLIESELYRDDLVKTDILQNALEENNMEIFFCTWNEELERIYEKCRWALDSLTCKIDELSREICTIASPLQNPDRQSLCDVHRFISSYLKDWQIQHQRNQKESSEIINKPSFDTYFNSLQSKFLATEDPGLSHYIQQVCQWEYDFFLYKQYFQSQMAILSDIIQYQDTFQRLLQTRWDRRYNQCTSTSQALEDRIKILLEQSSPAREDFTCAICLSVLSEPVTIAPCLHTFCRPCIQHLYCTCTLTSCSSPCHRASRRQRPEQYYSGSLRNKNNNSQRRSSLQSFQQDNNSNMSSPRRTYSGYRSTKRHSSISYSRKKQKLLACQCYPNNAHDSLMLQKHHNCPLCRSPFTLKDCTINVALDNFISLYFPYEEKVDDEQGEGPTQQKRRSVIYTAVQQLWSSSTARVEQQANSDEGLASITRTGSNNRTNEPTPRSRHPRYQHRSSRPESSAANMSYNNDVIDRDLYNLARRSWWF